MLRSELRDIIARSCDGAGVTPEAKTRLMATADNIDKVLVGSYFAEVEGQECGCPATLAGYYVSPPEYDYDDPRAGDWDEDFTEEGLEHHVDLFVRWFDMAPEFNRRPVGWRRRRWDADGVECHEGIEFVRVTD